MNKKFLSAILFGALMVTSTGTFVSCKDYDDDIENLQSQINNLATKSDVEAKLSQLQAALDAAKAESSANAAKIAAIKQCQCDVDAMMKKVQDAVDADMKKYADEINALIEQAEAIVGEIADYVTSVELVDSYTAANGNWANADKRGHVVVSTTIEKENVFSKDIANAITFVKGAERQTPNSFLVRVSPTNAVLTPEMISLVNSKGESLADVMEIHSVEKADVLLNRDMPVAEEDAEVAMSRAAGHGLWKISVKAKNYGDGKAFNAATITKVNDVEKSVLFAAQVNNALASAEARYVSSTYDLSFGWTKFVPAAELNFTVDGTDVATINNRFDKTSASLKQKENLGTIATEYEWATSTEKYPTPAVAMDKDKNNVVAVKDGDADDRSAMPVALAVQGKAMKIALFETNEKGEKVAPKNVRAIYVTLDKANAVESAPSELNAWNSYSYTGLNTVVENTSTEITINSEQTINDYIGFRVYAVNYDGTLVDPDGKAFYVMVGAQGAEWNTVNTTIYPTKSIETNNAITGVKSELADVTASKLDGVAKIVWEMADDKQVPFSVVLCDADGKYFEDAVFAVNGAMKVEKTTTFNFDKVAKVYTVPSSGKSWTDYEDDKAYTGYLTAYDKNGFVLAKLTVTMTKKLPTELPEGFSFKDKQVINGIYNCYMIASPWAAPTATKGTMPVENFIYFGEGLAEQYKVTVVEAADDANKDGKKENVVANGTQNIEVTPAYVDNTTEYTTVVEYNYGQVSSKKTADGKDYINVIVKAAEIKTVFCCFYKPEVHTWGWATREQLAAAYPNANPSWTAKEGEEYVREIPTMELTYGTEFTLPNNGTIDMYIFGKNSINNIFSTPLADTYKSSLLVVDAKLVSDATQHEDYFDVVFDGKVNTLTFEVIKKDEGSNPQENVPSTLIIKCKDSYNHDITISLPMIVKPF